jgi:hypothetical protein
MNGTNLFDNFNAEELVDVKLLSLLTDNNSNLNKKLQNDFDSHIREINYKNLIYFYNRNIDLSSISLNREGALLDVANIINETDYITPNRESEYFKNISDLLTLKHLLNTVEKTKTIINNKINRIRQQVISDACQKFVFNTQLKKSINEIFPNKNEEEIIGNALRNKARPETAKPKLRSNTSFNDDNSKKENF